MDETTIRNFDPLGGPVDTVVDRTLRDLALNIMRVARGTGDPTQVVRQVLECGEALKRYRGERRQAPSAQDVKHMLDFNRDRPFYDPTLRPEVRRYENAVDAIVRGALGVAAARYRNDHHQASRGVGEIMDGARRLTSIER